MHTLPTSRGVRPKSALGHQYTVTMAMGPQVIVIAIHSQNCGRNRFTTL